MTDFKSIEYIESRNPRFSAGIFEIFYEEGDNRADTGFPFGQYLTSFSAAIASFNSTSKIKIQHYQNYRSYSLDELRPNSIHQFTDKKLVMPEVFSLKCPGCGGRGQMKNGWRARCIRCFTWFEIENSLRTDQVHTWRNNLNTRITNGVTKYFHYDKEIDEREFLYWKMYYKLL